MPTTDELLQQMIQQNGELLQAIHELHHSIMIHTWVVVGLGLIVVIETLAILALRRQLMETAAVIKEGIKELKQKLMNAIEELSPLIQALIKVKPVIDWIGAGADFASKTIKAIKDHKKNDGDEKHG